MAGTPLPQPRPPSPRRIQLTVFVLRAVTGSVSFTPRQLVCCGDVFLSFCFLLFSHFSLAEIFFFYVPILNFFPPDSQTGPLLAVLFPKLATTLDSHSELLPAASPTEPSEPGRGVPAALWHPGLSSMLRPVFGVFFHCFQGPIPSSSLSSY